MTTLPNLSKYRNQKSAEKSLLREVIDYRTGKGKYDFHKLPHEQRGIATLEAWEDLECRILAFLDQPNQTK